MQLIWKVTDKLLYIKLAKENQIDMNGILS